MRLPRLLRQPLMSLLAVLAVAVGVVAMHQLSVGHTAVVPPASTQSAPAADGSMQHRMHTDTADSGSSTPNQPNPADGCLGCEHELIMAGCLAVVALLILAWMLPPLRRRWIVTAAPAERPRMTWTLQRWRRRSLRLIELSIRRT